MSVLNPSSFLGLPTELRRSIYIHYSKDAEVWIKQLNKIRPASSANPPRSMALLHTCRQIQSEASPLFYDQALFHVRRQNRHENVYSDQVGCYIAPSYYINVTGIRKLTLPIEALSQVGYRFHSPGRWKIKRPFQWVQHLTVDIRDHHPFSPCSIQEYPLEMDKIQTYDANLLKVMSESPGYSFGLSVRNYVCYNDLGRWTELIMVDVAQVSTWRCEGYPDGLHYRYLQGFLQKWGLSSDQIQSVFIRGGIKWHEYKRRQRTDQTSTDEDFLFGEQIEEIRQEIDELAVKSTTADDI